MTERYQSCEDSDSIWLQRACQYFGANDSYPISLEKVVQCNGPDQKNRRYKQNEIMHPISVNDELESERSM